VGAAMAQPPVAPTTNEPVGPVRGDNFENYNITQSFELGYRFASIGGDVDMYRATVNYMNGVRLLSSSLFVQSRDGHGGWFDQITLNTLGLGGDPYESASLRVEKNGLYRYDMLWRENAFFDPALTISYGEHLRNTTRTMQDHDLTLFPQSNYKIFLGYSRNVDDGPALSTIQLFNSRGNEYPLFADIHDQQNEYRLGGEAVLLGFRLNVLHSWVDFKEDTPTNIFYTPELGNNPGSGTLTAFTRAEPYHGTSPYWRVGLFREGKRLWAVNGRFTYVDSQRGFIDNEFASGSNLFGNLTAQQILSFGNARRPSLAANLNVTLFPRTNVTITNQSTYNDKRTVGDAVYSQYLVGTLSSPVVAFTYLGIRDFANSTNVEVRFGKRFAVHAGYQYSDRRIGVISGQQNFGDPAPTPPDNTPISQVNVLNAGILGFRFRPVKAFTILADAEIGRNSQPFTPISDRNYQALRGRAEYKLKSLRFGASARSETNTNSISLTSFASHSRNYGADFSWAPMERFSIDASYSYLHLMTMGGIYFFVNQAAVNGNSIYLSNIHAGNIATRIAVTKRADVFLGYTHTEDVAGTNGTLCAYGAGCIPAVPGEPFNLNQSFPVRFLSPQARLSIRLNNRVRWNAGYQYYGYNQVLASVQNYRAQTGYSSLLWSF
jgi:hypothetical protein